jgi:hypothetical protein
VVAAVAVVALGGGVVLFERSLIFFPSRSTAGEAAARSVAERSGVHIEDVWCTAADGVRLHGWLATGSEGAGGKVLLWFHGNAGNLFDRVELLIELARTGQSVLILDYRGYGRSEGRPSESGLAKDARAAWSYLVDERSLAPGQIVLLGKSLGGAVAVRLATETEPAGLIVQSSFTSIPAMAARHYPFVPQSLVRTQMSSLDRIGDVRCPVLVIHGTHDEIVPYDMGEALYRAAPEPKQLHTVEGATHNDTWLVGGRAYLEAIRRFVEAAVRSGAEPG